MPGMCRKLNMEFVTFVQMKTLMRITCESASWKSIIKVVCKIESYMWLWCKSQATYLMRVKNYGRHTLCTNIFVVEYKKMILFRMCYIGDKISESNFSAVKSLISWTKTLLINFSIQHENLRVHIFWRCNPIENTLQGLFTFKRNSNLRGKDSNWVWEIAA